MAKGENSPTSLIDNSYTVFDVSPPQPPTWQHLRSLHHMLPAHSLPASFHTIQSHLLRLQFWLIIRVQNINDSSSRPTNKQSKNVQNLPHLRSLLHKTIQWHLYLTFQRSEEHAS